MNNQQKYINYVVDDLVKKTEIDNEQQKINAPFLFSFPSILPFLFPSSPSPSILFSNYIKNLYGTRDDEVSIIWDIYRERIQTLINNE